MKQFVHGGDSIVAAPSVPFEGSGYASAAYAASFAEFGTPTRLPQCGAWLLRRPIGSAGFHDLMGCYPMLCCRDLNALERDLGEIADGAVSVAAVLDPLASQDEATIRRVFPDVAFVFKQHFVADLTADPNEFVAPRHLRNVRRAQNEVRVEQVEDLAAFVDDWVRLYDVLIERHAIRGMLRFSRTAFATQLSSPGMVAFRAVADDECVGALLFTVQDREAYYHLGAYSDRGYQLRASFALFWQAIGWLREHGVVRLALGGGAGAARNEGAADGLADFKRGWSTGTRPAWFVGRILDHAAYARLTSDANPSRPYFPAYRAGEFA